MEVHLRRDSSTVAQPCPDSVVHYNVIAFTYSDSKLTLLCLATLSSMPQRFLLCTQDLTMMVSEIVTVWVLGAQCWWQN